MIARATYAAYWKGVLARRENPPLPDPVGWNYFRWIWLRPNAASGSFPETVVPIRLTGITAALAGATDVKFERDDGTQLPHRIARYDAVSGDLTAWVRLPAFDGRTGLLMRVVYDNASASDQQAAASTVFSGLMACWNGADGADLSGNSLDLTATDVTANALLGWPAGTFNGSTSELTRADPTFLDGLTEWSTLLLVKHDLASWSNSPGLYGNGPIAPPNGADRRFNLTFINEDANWQSAQNDGQGSSIWSRSVTFTPHAGPMTIGVTRMAGEPPAFVIDGDDASSTTGGSSSSQVVADPNYPFRIGVGDRDRWQGQITGMILWPTALTVEHLRLLQGCMLGDDYWMAVGPQEATGTSDTAPLACRQKGSVVGTGSVTLDVLDAAIDPENGSLTVTDAGTPASGSATTDGSTVTYTGADTDGDVSWNATISDGTKTGIAPITVTTAKTPTDELPTPLRTIDVTTRAELDAAITAAQPGDEIRLADGSYGSSPVSITCAGTQTNPIVIRAVNNQAVWVPGFDFDAAAADVIVWGIDLKDAVSWLRGTRNIFRRCRIWPPFSPNSGKHGVYPRVGTDCRIDYCEIRLYTTDEVGGGSPWGEVTYGGVWGNYWGTTFEDGDFMKNLVIERCLFTGGPSGVGYSTPNCQFVEAQGDPAKTQDPANRLDWVVRLCFGDVPRDRTLFDFKCGWMNLDRVHMIAPGRVQLRDARNHTVKRCRFEGGVNVAVSRYDHEIHNCALDRIDILAGNAPYNDTSGPSVHAACRNVWLANCSWSRMRLGHQYDANYTYPADLTKLENCNGSITYGLHTNTTESPTSGVAVETPITLTANDVGPYAPWVGVEP